MNSNRRAPSLIRRLWPLPVFGGVLGVCVWAVVEIAYRPGVERLSLWLLLSLILVAVAWLVARERTADLETFEPSLLETPLRLARDTEVFERYREFSRSLLSISWQNDPIYREVALQRLAEMAGELHSVAHGEVNFEGTETWRIVYEKLLRSPGLFQYRSVSRMTTDSYWQDEPGRRSLKVNIELHQKEQISVERIVIVKDSDWLSDAVLPSEKIRQWIHQQHVVGIWIALVRESQLANEPELLTDFGIYGGRAVGTQQVDALGRTTSFRLQFGFSSVEQAEARWKRLEVYATSYGDLLDHLPLDG